MTALLDTLAPETREAASEAIKEQQRVLIDRLVRAARSEGWCGEFERSMRVIFPDGHPDTGSTDVRAWVDSDGYTCRGVTPDGYMPDGFHADTGLDRDGYNRRGLDRDGFDRDGYSRYGFNRDGFDRDGCNTEGYTAEGRDRQGNLRGTPEALAYEYRFDANGWDADGFNISGTHRESGLNRHDHANRFRFNASGHARPAS
jgi:hypothetical protein